MDRMLYTVTETSRLLSIRKTKIYELMNRGDLPSIKIDRSRRIPKESIEALIDRQTTPL